MILCANKDDEVVELMGLDSNNHDIQVAEYWLQLPSKEQLQTRLHNALEKARLAQLQYSENKNL